MADDKTLEINSNNGEESSQGKNSQLETPNIDEEDRDDDDDDSFVLSEVTKIHANIY